MMYFSNQPEIRIGKSRGYSLVEVLVAITVLLVALVGPLTIAQAGLKRAVNSREQTMATFLAQEGVEAVVKLREDNALEAYPNFDDLGTVWNSLTALAGDCTASLPCGVLIGNDGAISDTSFYRCNATSCLMHYTSGDRVPYRQNVTTGTVTAYDRRIQLDVTNDRVVVTSTVTWGTRPDQRVSMQTYIYNIYYEPAS